MMPDKRVIVVAVEDSATAGIVAVAAAHLSMEQQATDIVLLHVLDSHNMATGLFSTVGAPPPVAESDDEGKAILELAEAALRAEYAALGRDVPSIEQELAGGNPRNTIREVATTLRASAIVVGARRPHAFGRLVHPDVRLALQSHGEIPVHVAALQGEDREVGETVTG